MNENVYVDKKGQTRSNFSLEATDTFVFKEIKELPPGKFGKTYYLVTVDDKWIKLTGGQHSFFEREDVQPNTALKCETYTNSYGTFIGLRYGDSNQVTAVNEAPKPVGLPTLKPKEELTLSNDEETVLNQLVGNKSFTEWKQYGKGSVDTFKEAFEGTAQHVGVPLTITGGRLEQIYNLYLTKA